MGSDCIDNVVSERKETALMGGLIYRFVQAIYNRTIRTHLPRKLAYCNGVVARDAFLLDAQDIRPWYKQNLVDKTREVVDPGDTVVDVAAGRGVVAVAAAQEGADVVSYDASDTMLDVARETREMNDYPVTVEFRKALIGDGIRVYGDQGDVDQVSPAELPDCDVLTLDCEGTELSIIEGIRPPPETIVVETHPKYGAPPEAVEAALSDREYTATVFEMIPGKEGLDKHVVVATQDGSG